MSELLNLSVYNPGSLSDQDFLKGFVARQAVAHRLIERLAEVTPDGLATHHLIVGQRGMGKTSMLRRLALAATDDPRLSAVLLPLSFREEQYNVHSLNVFWANCLDALGDWFDRNGQLAKAERLDKDIAALSGKPTEALSLFNKWIGQEKRRPLLLLDNIDLIFAGLRKEQDALREFVGQPGGAVIVGGSATQVDEISDAKSEMHRFFEITKLDRLSKDELIACLRSLATARGAEGQKVLHLVDNDSGRIRTLHDLTGGNPRTLTLLYMLLELDSGGDVFSDLERLLDQVTVLYKARVEDLPAQARVVLDAVALTWNPVLASEVATTTLLEVTLVSSQLDRLQKEGVIEKVPVSKTTKSAYQISERFFNIWYLMRHGQRRQRSRLRWLTVFLRSFYTHAQLVERAKIMVSSMGELGADSGPFLLALSDAIEDEGWRSLLKNQARDEFEKYALSLGRTLDEIVDPSDVPRPQTAVEWVRHGNLLRQHLKRAKEAEKAFLTAIELDKRNYAAWFNLGAVRLQDMGQPAGAAFALKEATVHKHNDLSATYLLASALAEVGEVENAKAAYRACLRINPRFYLAAIGIGDLFAEEGLLEQAEGQFQLAGRLAPKTDTQALHASAFFAGYVLEDYERALKLYLRLLNIEPTDFVAQTNVAVLRSFVVNELPLSLDEELLKKHSLQGQALILALHAMRHGDKATAMSSVNAIFDDNSDQVFETYRGFVMLFMREAARQGWGDLLIRVMDETGASDRNWPLRAAYEAYLFGKNRLLDVNPEVRTAASKIFSLLFAPKTYQEVLKVK